MAQRGLLVVNKQVPKRSTETLSSSERRSLRPIERKAITLFETNHPLPLGVSVYRTENGHEVVRGKFLPFGAPPGIDCPHDLWVDDGALVDVRINSAGHQLKVAHARAVSAYAVPTDKGRQLHIEWHLPCRRARAGGHRFTTTSAPRNALKARKTPDPSARALNEVRVISRLDAERFAEIHGLRNNTESFHSWAKSTLGTGKDSGRAQRLDAGAQLLDHLCIMVLRNARTALHATFHTSGSGRLSPPRS